MARSVIPARSAARRGRIRPRVSSPSALAFCHSELTRAQALVLIAHSVQTLPLPRDIQDLMSLFQVDGEELAEQGVSYETLKALERSYPLLFSLTSLR